MSSNGNNSSLPGALAPSSLESELRFVEDIFQDFKAIEALGGLPPADSVQGLILKILKNESTATKFESSLKEIAQNLGFTETLKGLWQKLASSSGLIEGATSKGPLLSDLRECVLSYIKRKYIAFNIFGEKQLPKNRTKRVKIFLPLVDYVFPEQDTLCVGITMGLILFKGDGESCDLKARLRTRSSADSTKLPPVSPIFKNISSLNLNDGDIVEDSRKLEFSLMPPPNSEGPFDLEIVVVSGSGDLLERAVISLPTELRPVNFGLVSDLIKAPAIKPQYHEAKLAKPKKSISVTLPSQISDITLRSENKNLIISYSINLVGGLDAGFYLMIDLLDEEGRVLKIRNSLFNRYYFDHKKFQHLNKGDLSFGRFIPLGKKPFLKLKEDLVLPRKIFGLGLFSKEIVVSIFLFDAANNKLDEVEQGFVVSVKPGFIRGLRNLLMGYVLRIGRFFKAPVVEVIPQGQVTPEN
jgi:hypothetical protein